MGGCHRWCALSDAQAAVELKAPAMQLTLVIEGARGSEIVHQIIRWMRQCKLSEIIQQPEVQQLFVPLYERHLSSIDLIRSRSSMHKGVIYFDLIGDEFEGYNKFIPYYLFPDSTYTVSVSTSSFRTKVSVGSNPWAPQQPAPQSRHYLRALRRRRTPRGGRHQLRDRRGGRSTQGGVGNQKGAGRLSSESDARLSEPAVSRRISRSDPLPG